ncbi:Asp23/Gls24 family envelope stress response protein [Anaerofilum sp. BX8]|uniref:Asp23/Gls24 family envelope stress response protein n=1 Tax=Anaerofilum hominis TaxID=2763016 RepID=A0A923L237_9FIRM|nr:Asp23/Gls24 family envelope stress response protein [Anaerofilum hominis]MBC5582445.1 Asp23/Gls24 family envelope stress response protein [Anaerofilum hominis]
MINFYNTFGKVSMTGDYFAGLVSAAASSCYGVADMATSGASDTVKGMIFGSDHPDKGVRVTEDGGKLVIELHIKVTYGLNISAIVKSITHKVKYVVEDATGLQVKKINVSVDDIVS